MGQQQLILLVLATVIVGIAIVVGIAAFTENSAKANADAMIQDAVRMANDAQAAVKKPDPFGGVDDFSEVTLGILGYPNTNDVYSNLNGNFTIDCPDATGCVITGVGGEGINLQSPVIDQTVVVAVCGSTDADIEGAITLIGGQATGTTAPSCTTS